MQIFTSYFANAKNLSPVIIPISIALKTPIWYTGARYNPLAPTGEIFSAWKVHRDNDLYMNQYEEDVLFFLNPLRVFKDIQTITGGKDAALLCYERPEDFCHRHRAAAWLTSHGVEVREWGGEAGKEEWVQERWF